MHAQNPAKMPSTVVTGRAGPCPGVEILRGERLARAHTWTWAMSTNTNMDGVAEFIGEGLEADPTRGVRIKPSAFHAVPGVPRSSEYDSVLEQDPFGDTHETGGNDDIWGEWGLDRDAPFLSTFQAMGMLATGLGALYVTYKTAVANSPKPVAAPREGLWEQDKVGMSVPE